MTPSSGGGGPTSGSSAFSSQVGGTPAAQTGRHKVKAHSHSALSFHPLLLAELAAARTCYKETPCLCSATA